MNNYYPLVSVIIPSYNHEQFVQECIQSVIDQDYQNIELIIIDDGSKDNSVQKIEEMRSQCEKRFVRFEFRHRHNKGLCATLNEGLIWSDGDYYSTFASDDIMLPDKISTQVIILNENPNCIGLFSGAELINENGIKIRTVIPSKRALTHKDIILSNYTILAPSQLLRKRALDKLKKPIYEEDILLEDWYLWIKLSLSCGYLMNTDKVLVKYRQHENNTMKNNLKIQKGRIDVLNKFSDNPLYKKASNIVSIINFLESKEYLELLKFIVKHPSLLIERIFYKKILILIINKLGLI